MPSERTVAIACQGGGSHAAFTAGALKTLLREEAAGNYRIIGFSGTSGGALSALLAWYGLLTGGTDTAIDLLDSLWQDNAAASPYEVMYNTVTLAAARSTVEVKSSPYEFPLSTALDQQRAIARMQAQWGFSGLREVFIDLPSLLEKHVAFEAGPAPRKVIVPHPPVRETRLVVGAVDIISGEFEAFDSETVTGAGDHGFDPGGISLEAVLASAAIPMIFRAVRIGEYAYWDGLFSQNPPVRDFVAGRYVRTADKKPDEIWVLQVNQQGGREPTTPYEIEDRRNELAGNLSLNQEIRAIRTVNNTVRDLVGKLPGGTSALKAIGGSEKLNYKLVDVRRIKLDRARVAQVSGRRMDVSSKLDRDGKFLRALIAHGEEQAAQFVTGWHAGTIPSET